MGYHFLGTGRFAGKCARVNSKVIKYLVQFYLQRMNLSRHIYKYIVTNSCLIQYVMYLLFSFFFIYLFFFFFLGRISSIHKDQICNFFFSFFCFLRIIVYFRKKSRSECFLETSQWSMRVVSRSRDKLL